VYFGYLSQQIKTLESNLSISFMHYIDYYRYFTEEKYIIYFVRYVYILYFSFELSINVFYVFVVVILKGREIDLNK